MVTPTATPPVPLPLPASYQPGKHVHADLSDFDPGDRGTVRCMKCLATQDFEIGPRGGYHATTPWTRDGKPARGCLRQ